MHCHYYGHQFQFKCSETFNTFFYVININIYFLQYIFQDVYRMYSLYINSLTLLSVPSLPDRVHISRQHITR